MLLPPTALIAAEMVTLEACSLHGPHPRQRWRALAILGHHRGQSLPRVAALFAVRYATVHDWRRAWQQRGLAGLAEGRRAGRLPKLSEAAKKVTTWLGPATQQLRTLRPRIGRELGVRLSTSSLRRLARRLGYGWKRLRRSLKDRRDNVLFGFFQQELAALHRSERAGEVAVVYVDEGRVSRQAPVPYAWQVRGQAAVGRPAERGAGAIPCSASGRRGPPTRPAPLSAG